MGEGAVVKLQRTPLDRAEDLSVASEYPNGNAKVGH